MVLEGERKNAFNAQEILVYSMITCNLVFHLLYAYYGQGFYHADKYFQILEFASLEITFSSSSIEDLPWEFYAK